MTDDPHGRFDFVDTWRPSRMLDLSRGQLAWGSVDLLQIGSDSSATVLRPALESMGLQVNYFRAAMADHVKAVLGGTGAASADYLIVCAHGADDERSIDMGGDLAPELAATQDFGGVMSPEDLAGFVDVTGKVVVVNACFAGNHDLSEAFIAGGAAAYIADQGAPFGYVSALFPLLLFYFLTNYPDRSLADCFDSVVASDPDEFGTWILKSRGK